MLGPSLPGKPAASLHTDQGLAEHSAIPREKRPCPVKPQVSVLMSSYNHAPFVADAIHSVLRQSFADFEFLICDDGSTDGTVEVIRGFDDPRIVFFGSGPNRGSAARRNELIARSRGQYIAIQNSDDVWFVDKLAHQIDIMERKPELGAVFGQALFIGPDSEPKEWPSIFLPENRSQGRWLRRFLEASNCLCHSSVVVRKSCHDVVGTYDCRFRQLVDMDMWARLVKHQPIFVSDRVLVSFRVSEDAVSSSNPDAVARMHNDQYLIADGMFDDVSHDVMKQGFGDLLVFREPPTELHWDIEKALLYLSVSTKFELSYALIGLRRLHGLLASPRHAPVLLNDYRIDHLELQRISTRASVFAKAVLVPGLMNEIAHQGNEIADQGEIISSLRASRSWLITRPFRYLSGRVRQLRRPD